MPELALAAADAATDAAHVSDDACKALWCDALHQAVADAKAPAPEWVERDWDAIAAASRAKTRRTPESFRAQAWRTYLNDRGKWLADRDYIGSRSFKQVCWLCGIDPEAAEWRIRQQMVARSSAEAAA